MPEGGQQRATGQPRSVEDWGETYRARTPRVYPEDRGLNGRPRTAAGGANAPPPRGDQRKARKKRKRSADEGNDIPKGPKAWDGEGGPERKPIRRALHGAAPAQARRGQRRLKTATTSGNGRGPAPEVSCNPPAEQPRPPFAFRRETYRLELRGSCGQVQATSSLYLDHMRRFTLIPAHTTDLNHHTEITLQVIPKLKYTLRLLVDNRERELLRINNQTWEPAKPLYAPCLFDTCNC